MNKLNILNLALTTDGGAGIATQNLNNIFNRAGHNSVLIVQKSNKKIKNTLVLNDIFNKYFINKANRFITFIIRRIKFGNRDSNYCFHFNDENGFSFSADKILSCISFTPDIIILHYIATFINSSTIKELSQKTGARILWIMMDNSPLTGGCHFPWDCEGYKFSCDQCPALIELSKKWIAKNNLALKLQNLPEHTEIIACSESDFRRAKSSVLFSNRKIHKILLPVNAKDYNSGNLLKARSHFKISIKKKVIFYGSLDLIEERKGGKFFVEALIKLEDMILSSGKSIEDYLILIAGNGDFSALKDIQIPLIKPGYLNESSLIKAYQSADVFVVTSIEDSGPFMINQAISCGTPVVCFDMGVARDLVVNDKTGFIAPLFDSKALADGIFDITSCSVESYQRIQENCIQIASQKLNASNQFLNLFSEYEHNYLR